MDGSDPSSSPPVKKGSSYLTRELTDHFQQARATARRADATVLKISDYMQKLRGRVAQFRARADSQHIERDVLTQAVEELGISHEELRIAEEELRRQDEALAESRHKLELEQSRYHELMELADDGYLTTDTYGVVHEANRAIAEMLKIDQDFLIGKPLTSFVARADARPLLQALRAGRDETWSDRIELRLRPRLGDAPFFAELTGRAVRQPGPQPGTTAVMIRWGVRDVSARKEAERTTLEEQLDARVRARTSDLETANRSQAKLIEELLDASRALAGSAPMILESVEIGRVVKSAVDAARADLDPRLPLAVFGAHVDCRVLGDVARLEQLVRRLVLKAFDSAAERVEVRVERDGSCAHVIVSAGDRVIDDERTSAGIPNDPELMLPHAIVDLHGGTLRSAVDGEGRWRQFTIKLPMGAVSSDMPRSEALSAEELSSIDLDGVRALVVDADHERRELLVSILRDRGAEVTTATNTAEALMVVEDWRPDVLVSDIGLPDDAGFDLIRKVRRLGADKGGAVPAIALTGYADLEACRRALLAGYQIHVAKPIDASLLAHAVANVAGVPIAELTA